MSFNCTDKDTLVAYIYGECDGATRGSIDAHLAACPACADEVAGFGMVRESLSQWTPPGRVGSFRLVRDDDQPAAVSATILRPARWWQASLPTLAKVAAGILLFAGGAAIANLEVRYDKDGLVVRTGWQRQAPVTAAATPAPAPQGAAVVPASAEPAPTDPSAWRAEMASLERHLRDEFRQQIAAVKVSAATPAPVQVAGNVGFDENRFMQRVHTLLDESERRQQVDMAYRMSVLMEAQRSNEMRRIGFTPDLPAVRPQPRPKNGMLFDVSLKK